MDNISPIKERILQYLEIKDITKMSFCEKTGISYANMKGRSLLSEIGGSQIGEILSVYEDLSPEWLLTGKGPMLRGDDSLAAIKQPFDNKAQGGIPLVSINAIAGFGSANFAIAEADVKDYYVVPKFKYCKVDFMIEISGSSMYPKYNSGDVVACTILHEQSFIQWNKCHIIATREQGILCKRLLPSQREDCITAVSDNHDYPPFDIPLREITGIALVCGVIRLE